MNPAKRILLGTLIAVLAGAGLSYELYAEFHEREFLRRAARATATVMSNTHHKTARSEAYEVVYAVTVNGEDVTGSDELEVDSGRKLEIGDKIEVLYSLTDPHANQIANMSHGMDKVSTGVAAAFLVLGVVAVVRARHAKHVAAGSRGAEARL